MKFFRFIKSKTSKIQYIPIENWAGKWALITGASKGIGREFCIQLAKNKINLVMVSRDEKLLNTTSQELTDTYNIKTIILPMDLTKKNAASLIHEQIKEKSINISLLINNISSLGKNSEKFLDLKYETLEETIHTNVLLPTQLIHKFASDLKLFKPGLVINISSQAAFQPIPFMAIYAASKSYIQSLSLGLYEELSNEYIIIQTLIPGPTITESTIFDDKVCSLVKKWDYPEMIVSCSLNNISAQKPIVSSVKNIYWQRIFACIFQMSVIKFLKRKLERV